MTLVDDQLEDLADLTLIDENTKLILTDDANKEIPTRVCPYGRTPFFSFDLDRKFTFCLNPAHPTISHWNCRVGWRISRFGDHKYLSALTNPYEQNEQILQPTRQFQLTRKLI